MKGGGGGVDLSVMHHPMESPSSSVVFSQSKQYQGVKFCNIFPIEQDIPCFQDMTGVIANNLVVI